MVTHEFAGAAAHSTGIGALAGVRLTKDASGDAESAESVSLMQTIKPFVAVLAVIATGSMLVVAIYYTLLDLQWIAFLAGVLVAAMLTMASQAARTEMASASRAERLTLTKYQLTGETVQREKLEQQLAVAKLRLHYSDEALPVMLAFVDESTRFQYHNRAFRDWLGLPDAKIDGRHLRDVLGRRVFAELEPFVLEAAAGRAVRFERTQRSAAGTPCRVAVQYLPQSGADGKCSGFYMVVTDITARQDAVVAPLPEAQVPAAAAAEPGLARSTSEDAGKSDQSVAILDAEWQDASKRILAAINGNEFALFCQHITPLAVAGNAPEHYEILIRLFEEESSLVPPGAFFALAEEHGLLPQLDRWVLTHVLDWMAGPAGLATVRAGSIYFINVSAATMRDPDFPEFVELQLHRTGVPPGLVCVEIAEQDLTLYQGDAVAFASAMRQCGCLVAVSGFGRNRQAAETLKMFPVDFLKIDGGIVRQIVAYPAYLGRAVAISKLARALGVRTIAEMVEDEPTVAMLRKLNVNFAQGFGISRPQLLADLNAPADEGIAQHA
jgi:PAS domain S-box-containing protein